MPEYRHVPVMLAEVLEQLAVKPGEHYLDGTFGGGGYSRAIALACAPGQVVAFDLDPLAQAEAEKLSKQGIANITLIPDNFRRMRQQLEAHGLSERLGGFAGLVLDLGLSSAQLADRERGFSFQADSPLDMSFGGKERSVETTEAIVNQASAEELERILKRYGEEPFARSIARSIVLRRSSAPLATTGQLLGAIEAAIPAKARYGARHYATRTFQALRIATNQELDSLAEVLEQSLDLLKPGGHLVVVSYHSLEDRLVKQFLREQARDCVCPPTFPVCRCDHRARLRPLTGKPLLPSEKEVEANPRARSAKLRAAIIL